MTLPVRPIPKDMAAQCHEPAANTAAVITLTGRPSMRWLIRTLGWSYSAAPTGGRIQVAVDGVVLLAFTITAAGPGALPLEYLAPDGATVVITVSAGGGVITCIANVLAGEMSGSAWEQ